jgi:HEAT repeat protein
MTHLQDTFTLQQGISQSLSGLIELSQHTDLATRKQALGSIGNLDWSALFDCVMDALEDSEPEVRLLALETLVNMQMTQALPLIERCFLEDSSEIVRGRAALCIALLSYKPKFKLLLKGTEDQSPSIQLTSWMALYLSGAEQSLDAITKFLMHDDPKLRIASIELLRLFCSQQDKNTVIDLLSERFKIEPSIEVSNAIQEGLMELGG